MITTVEYQQINQVKFNNNNNNNNNASISTVQNKLSSVVLTEVQTNMSLVFRQKSAEKWMSMASISHTKNLAPAVPEGFLCVI